MDEILQTRIYFVYRFATQLGQGDILVGKLNSLRTLNFRANIYSEYTLSPWHITHSVKFI